MKQLFRVLTENEVTQPVLSMRAGQQHFSFSITDFITGKVKMLGYYSGDDATITFLKELLDLLPELKEDFFKVMLCYDFPQSMLVPASIYSHNENAGLMMALFGVNNGNSIFSEKLGDWQLYNLYAIPTGVHEWISTNFPTAKYWHQYSVMLKNISAVNENGTLLADFREKDFSLLLVKNNKLLLAQTFEYAAPADVIYYLLKSCQQFSLTQQRVDLKLSGLIDRDSAMYKDLYQYFLNISFREAGWNIEEGQYPEHYFTSLNDLAKCAL